MFTLELPFEEFNYKFTVDIENIVCIIEFIVVFFCAILLIYN